MTIRFKCPGCQKTLGVKDQLAGKKANCPVCKRPFVIPRPRRSAPVARPANVEDFAAEALADPKQAEAPKQAAATIDFPCDWCGEDVKFGLEEAGKQVPCPHCRRIVKVPRPKVEPKKDDWRAAPVNDKPAWAKENANKQVLVGATTKGNVSGEALRDAGAIAEAEEEPLTRGEKVAMWLRRVGVAGLIIALLSGAWYGADVQRSIKRQSAALGVAEEAFKSKMPLAPEWETELHRAAGEFHLRKNTKQETTKALAHFHQALAAARTPAGKGGPPPEREVVLTDLALSLIELGGTDDQVLEKTRLDWKEDMLKELSRPLLAIPSAEGRAMALREVGARLLEKGQGPMAVALARKLSTEGERLGVGADPQGQRSPLAGQEVAFLLALKQDEAAARLLPLKGKAPLDLATRIGYAEGKARQGDFEGARQTALERGAPLHRLEALAGVAVIAWQQNKTPEARAAVEAAVKVLDGELKKKKVSPLILLPLARVAVRTESQGSIKPLTDALGDPGCVAQVDLCKLQRQLAGDRSRVDERLDELAKNKTSVAYVQGVEAVARVRTRSGARAEALEAAASAEESVRPFIQVGVALGEQDIRQ